MPASPTRRAPAVRRAVGRLVPYVLPFVVLEIIASIANSIWNFREPLLIAFSSQQSDADNESQWRDVMRWECEHTWLFMSPLELRVAGPVDPFRRRVMPEDIPSSGGSRVFIAGESAAFGFGVAHAESFAARLQERLKGRGFEVFNAGHPGANPNQTMGDACRIIRAYQPSVLVYYAGNNVWFNWTPPGQRVLSDGTVRILRSLASSDAFAALESLAFSIDARRRHASPGAPPGGFLDLGPPTGSAFGLAHPAEGILHYDPQRWLVTRQRYLDRFEASLVTIARQAKQRSVRLVLVTVPMNYRFAPSFFHPQFEAFDPMHAADVRRLLHEAARLRDQGDLAAALVRLDQVLALDPRPPLLHYLRAECLEESGRFDEAEKAYALSRDNTMGKMGSLPNINEIIRAAARREGVDLLDAAALFDEYEHTRGRYFNQDLILDSCHPTAVGHQIIAEALARMLY